MLTNADLAAIEARNRQLRSAVDAVVVGALPTTITVGTGAQGEALVAMLGKDIPRLLAEVRRLRTLATAQTGAATYKARGLQSRGRAASARRPEAPTRARRLAGRPIPPAAAPLADSRS